MTTVFWARFMKGSFSQGSLEKSRLAKGSSIGATQRSHSGVTWTSMPNVIECCKTTELWHKRSRDTLLKSEVIPHKIQKKIHMRTKIFAIGQRLKQSRSGYAVKPQSKRPWIKGKLQSISCYWHCNESGMLRSPESVTGLKLGSTAQKGLGSRPVTESGSVLRKTERLSRQNLVRENLFLSKRIWA